MLIRSQDKKRLYILENAKGIFVNDSHDICIDTSLLGIYSTEAKAIKVLDMIQSEYIRHRKCNGSNAITWFTPPKVFQMPQDSEVKE